jgi:hypothetical protein
MESIEASGAIETPGSLLMMRRADKRDCYQCPNTEEPTGVPVSTSKQDSLTAPPPMPRRWRCVPSCVPAPRPPARARPAESPVGRAADAQADIGRRGIPACHSLSERWCTWSSRWRGWEATAKAVIDFFSRRREIREVITSIERAVYICFPCVVKTLERAV